ncbi:hypothetical protein P3102_33810 [Amycolatopsis sp. QT-25]|uniref:hypothetical protein n=1 Tax=Amycolatopsis sp. QT-25 TaxID=3034022 RepID=UPI0023ED2AE8|nr:hypothetical protein [Amycolatopsis sp. QT-25]WET78961.1 hypothetical protein P3102_33810 [Amycolatopsis sp. QT-25]
MTTALMAVMGVVAGIGIVASRGQGIGWFLLVTGLVTALISAGFRHLARKSRRTQDGADRFQWCFCQWLSSWDSCCGVRA